MPAQVNLAIVRILAVFFVISVFGGKSCIAQDTGAPPWGEFLKRFEKDPLLKKPYHMMPDTEVKGLASKTRARELDIPNRKKAIRYLKDLDCTQFPEAKEMLLSLLNPEEEKWEEVRFEAARALRDMLARHSCNPTANRDTKGNAKAKSASENCKNESSEAGFWEQCSDAVEKTGRRARGERTKPQDAPSHCESCCDAKTLNTLAKTAYEMKEDGGCYEPSLRVREMAVQAIKVCGVPCNFKPYYGEFDEEPGPPAVDKAGREPESSDGEGVPPAVNEGDMELEAAPVPDDSSVRSSSASRPTLALTSTPIAKLEKLCIVSFAHGEIRLPNAGISTSYRGRIYYFADEPAKEEFISNPERFAVAFGGCDPVHFLATRQPVEGRYLVNHEGRFYMFSTKENVAVFKADPSRYRLQESTSARIASSK